MNPKKKTITVSCAVIERDGLVLAAQRSENMPMPLKWEFPGGKIHAGETPQECLRREVMEELDIEIEIKKNLPVYTHEYGDFIVTLFPFVCSTASGVINPREHKKITWASPDELLGLDWLPADIPVISAYLSGRED